MIAIGVGCRQCGMVACGVLGLGDGGGGVVFSCWAVCGLEAIVFPGVLIRSFGQSGDCGITVVKSAVQGGRLGLDHKVWQ